MGFIISVLKWAFWSFGAFCVCLGMAAACEDLTSRTIGNIAAPDFDESSYDYLAEECDNAYGGRGKQYCYETTKRGYKFYSSDDTWERFLNGRSITVYGNWVDNFLHPIFVGTIFFWVLVMSHIVMFVRLEARIKPRQGSSQPHLGEPPE